MAGSGSPCGACKFLRRKCVRGCVFEPYFRHEQGASHFSAIHRVFGASHVSKMLSNLPISERFEAAMTISYEAQARVHDPIYGCVSHIFALQQQVFNLQAQLALMREQTAQSYSNSSEMENPNLKFNEKTYHLQPQLDFHTWFQSESLNRVPQFDRSLTNTVMHSQTMESFENPLTLSENISFGETSHLMQSSFKDVEDLRSIAFTYTQ